MSPVITLLNMLPRARNEVTSTAPVVSVSTTTSESLMDTCERIMADPNPRRAIGAEQAALGGVAGAGASRARGGGAGASRAWGGGAGASRARGGGGESQVVLPG